MPCSLYRVSTSGNPLKVCGPEERLGYAPSPAHLKVYCLSTSAYDKCPMYKLKTTRCEKPNRWSLFIKHILGGSI